MLENMPAGTAQLHGESRLPKRPVTLTNLDRRRAIVQQVKTLLGSYQKQLRRKPTYFETAAMERAATLQVLATSARLKLLIGDRSVTPNEVVRLDNSARRAVADVQRLVGSKRKPRMTLQQYSAMKSKQRPPDEEQPQTA
jgi:hypothetical protein